jgi:hypothetical protein
MHENAVILALPDLSSDDMALLMSIERRWRRAPGALINRCPSASTDIDIGATSFSLTDRIDLPGVDGLPVRALRIAANNETIRLPTFHPTPTI